MQSVSRTTQFSQVGQVDHCERENDCLDIGGRFLGLSLIHHACRLGMEIAAAASVQMHRSFQFLVTSAREPYFTLYPWKKKKQCGFLVREVFPESRGNPARIFGFFSRCLLPFSSCLDYEDEFSHHFRWHSECDGLLLSLASVASRVTCLSAFIQVVLGFHDTRIPGHKIENHQRYFSAQNLS